MTAAWGVDPRAKLAAWTSALVAAAVLPDGWPVCAALGASVVVLIRVGAVRAALELAVKLVVPTAVMLALVYGLLVPPPEGQERVPALGLAVWPEGLRLAADKGCRLMLIGWVTVAFWAVITRAQLAGGLRAVGVPTDVVKMTISSLGMLPVARRRVGRIADAQRSRGLRPRGLFVNRLRVYVPILGPLLFGMLTDALERAALWEARGYMEAAPRWGRLAARDWLWVAGSGGLVAAAGVARWVW